MEMPVLTILVIVGLANAYTHLTLLLVRMVIFVLVTIIAMKENAFLVIPRTAPTVTCVLMIIVTQKLVFAIGQTTRHLAMIAVNAQRMISVTLELVYPVRQPTAMTEMCVPMILAT